MRANYVRIITDKKQLTHAFLIGNDTKILKFRHTLLITSVYCKLRFLSCYTKAALKLVTCEKSFTSSHTISYEYWEQACIILLRMVKDHHDYHKSISNPVW